MRFRTHESDGTFTHAVEYFQSTCWVWADADNIKGVEQNTDGSEKNPMGVDPWTEEDALSERYKGLKSKAYAVGESVSSMSDEKGEKHRRFRLPFLFDGAIKSAEHYHQIMRSLASEFPIIPNVDRSPAQPVFGNARVGFTFKILKNVLSLDDYPYKPAPETVSTPSSAQMTTDADISLEDYLKSHGVAYFACEKEAGKYFVECHNKSNHSGDINKPKDAYVFGVPFGFYCSHASCKANGDNTWQGFRSGNGISNGYNGNPSKVKAEAKTGKPDAESKPPARPKRENPLPKLKDGSDYFVHDDFNVLAMSAFIQSKYRIWAQDAGIFVYNKKTGIYELGEMDIDKAVREELGILRKKKFTDEVLADLRACCRITDLPDNSNLIGFRNGVLELAFGKDEVLQWKQHSPDNYLETVFPVDFDLNAPETDGQKDFDNWLTEALGGDMGLVKVCYEVIGSIFHKGSVTMQRGVLMVGEGGTGKSMLLSLIENIIGQKNLCARRWGEYGDSEFAFGDLFGKALAMDSDIRVETPISGAIKPAVTGNILTCNQKHKQPFDFNPFATWIGGINKFPKTRDKTWGFFRRWIVIPWNKNYETNSQFEVKKQRLWTEAQTVSRIISDAISLYITAYLQGSFSVPDVAKELQREMFQSANSVITWLDNETQKPSDNMDTDLTQILTRADAYAAYEEYCRQHNRDAENNRNFLETLRSQGFDCDKKITIGGARKRYIEGLFFTLKSKVGSKVGSKESPQTHWIQGVGRWAAVFDILF